MKNSSLLFLWLVIILLFSSCEHNQNSDYTSNDPKGELSAFSTESEQNNNPTAFISSSFITEETWGEVPGAEKAAQIYESYPKPDFDTCNAIGSDYLRMQTSSISWILENAIGQKLYCRDGILYGDMPYYCPVATEGYLKTDEPYVYEGGWLFIETSGKFTFLPECMDDSELVLTKRASFEGDGEDNVVWEYDVLAGNMKGTLNHLDYRRAVSFSVGNSRDKEILSRALGIEESIFLRGGKGVQKVVVSAQKVTVFGDGASYDSIKAISQDPPEIIFE